MTSARATTLAFLLLAGSAAGFAQAPQEFGAATFVAPAGWTLDSRPILQTFGWTRGRDRCLLVMSAVQSTPPGLDAAFSAAWRELFSNTYRRAARPPSAERTSPAGFRHAVGEGELEDAAGNRLIARLHVFPVGANSQWIVLIGNGLQALAACKNDWDAFFASLRFRSAAAEPAPSGGAPPPAPPAPPAAAPSGERPPPVAAVPNGAPQQFDNITFVPPRGWGVRRANGLVQLSPLGTRPAEKLDVLLLPGHVSSASLDRELEGTWSEIQSLLKAQLQRNVSGRPYDPDEPGQSLAGVEYLKGEGGMRNGSGTWDVYAYVMRAGNRVERVAVIAGRIRENLTETNPALHGQYSRDIRQLVFTMKFANQPERSLPPGGLRPGGIVGVWAGLGMSFGRIKTELAVFFDNGLAYFGPSLPTQGLYQIEPVAEQPFHRRDWGTYTWSSGSGALTMPYGTIPLRSTGPGLELTTNQTPHRYIKLLMPPNSRLDGTWCNSDGKCLRFTAAGRFQDNGAVRASEHSTYAWPQSPPGGEGQYTLRDHTLVLAYDGGPELRLAFPGLEDASSSSPNALRLGWNVDLLTRR